jgi:hypothetical protein
VPDLAVDLVRALARRAADEGTTAKTGIRA